MNMIKRTIMLLYNSLSDLHVPMLVFPIIVTLCVSIAFLFNGVCSAWQWWVGVSIGAFLCVRHNSIKRSFFNLALFALLLFCVKILSNLFIDSTSDCQVAHFPAIRSMILGWNPIYDGTISEWEKVMGISHEKMKLLYVLTMPKALYYFSAAAYYFIKSPYNLLFPIVPFMYMCVSITLWRTLSAKSKLLKIGLIFIAFIFTNSQVSSIFFHIDKIVAICALGLIASLFNLLKNKRANFTELIVYTFWMISSKPSSLLHAIIIWSVFSCFYICRCRKVNLKHLVNFCLILFLTFSFVSVSPYITSTLNFTHPLYPNYSLDKENFPISSLTGDFYNRNEDAKKMSHLGLFINAFVSEKLSNMYYSIKYNKPDFHPQVGVWEQQRERTSTTPTYALFKFIFCFFIIIFMRGKFYHKFIAISVLACSIIIPTEMVGFLRYTPFILMVACFIPDAIVTYDNKFMQYVCFVLFIVTTFCYMKESKVYLYPVNYAMSIDYAYALKVAIKNNPPQKIFYHTKKMEAELDLLVRMIPSFKNTEIYTLLSTEQCNNENYKFNVLSIYNAGLFKVRDVEYMQDTVIFRYNCEHKDPKERKKAIPINTMKVFLFEVPKSILLDFK